MKLTLAKVKYYPRVSKDSNAFEAVVVVNGTPICEVVNNGMGNQNVYHCLKGSSYSEMHTALEAVRSYCLPLISTLETMIDYALMDFLAAKDLKKAFKTKLVFVLNGELYVQKASMNECFQKSKLLSQAKKNSFFLILNDVPFDEALEVYKQYSFI